MAHAGVRRAIVRAGGVSGAGRMATHAGPRIDEPFGSASIVEGDQVRAIPVTPGSAPDAVAFLDGIQRYSVDAWFGVTPVVRAHVAAAVLRRADGALRAVATRREDFLVAPVARLEESQRAVLAGQLYDSEAGARLHPLLDIQLAVQKVEQRRGVAEAAVAREQRQLEPASWLIVDGSVTAHPALAKDPRLVGIVKSHETQFLEGADVETALTLKQGHRSSVFAPRYERGEPVHSWYLRLWDWEGQDITHGLIRVESYAAHAADADEISGWLLEERAPLSTPDSRWDRLLYPIHRVEELLRAQAGTWA